jgi:hypothetical protein
MLVPIQKSDFLGIEIPCYLLIPSILKLDVDQFSLHVYLTLTVLQILLLEELIELCLQ